MTTSMKQFHRLLLALVLSAPFAALADPVIVTTHSSGTSVVNNSVMNILGLDPVESSAPQPYELTLRSHFDTDTMLRPDDFWAHSYNSDVLIDFHIGSQVYRYAGPANSTVNLYGQSANVEEYSQRIWFDTPNYSFGFVHDLLGPTGSMGQSNPLAPLDVDQNDLTNYSTNIYVNLVVNDAPDFGMPAISNTISLQVMPVPEPASFALLAAGLGMLGLWRRRRLE